MSDTQRYVAAATVTLDARPSDIWALWADVNGWSHWDDGLERSEIRGNFKAGTPISLTPRGGASIEARIKTVTAGEEFSDEAVLPFGTIRSYHRMEAMGQRMLLTHEVHAEIACSESGMFEAQIWPHLQAGLPVALGNIAEIVRAE
jgi:Polyketide cyclase / dehydrase and lipid transport